MNQENIKQRVQQYESLLQKYSEDREKIQRDFYKYQERKEQLEAELLKEFGTTDIDTIEEQMQGSLQELENIEKELVRLIEEYNREFGGENAK